MASIKVPLGQPIVSAKRKWRSYDLLDMPDKERPIDLMRNKIKKSFRRLKSSSNLIKSRYGSVDLLDEKESNDGNFQSVEINFIRCSKHRFSSTYLIYLKITE